MSAGPIVPIGEGAVKVLSSDLLTIKGRVYRKIIVREPTGKLTKTGKAQYRKREILEPVDVEARVNPVGIFAGLAAGAVGVGLLVGKLELPSPFGGGVTLYEGPLHKEWEVFRRRFRHDEPDVDEPCPPPALPPLLPGPGTPVPGPEVKKGETIKQSALICSREVPWWIRLWPGAEVAWQAACVASRQAAERAI
jgi:hypothetical protein